MKIQDVITILKRNWSNPHHTTDSDPNAPDLEVACSFEEPGLSEIPANLPIDVAQFWKTCTSAKLFEDRQYGQWGLEIFTPSTSNEHSVEFERRRSRDFKLGDRVIGKFLGDSDLLLVRCDPSASDFGTTIVVLPLDPRADWEVVGNTFSEFLSRYTEAEGNKFWE